MLGAARESALLVWMTALIALMLTIIPVPRLRRNAWTSRKAAQTSVMTPNRAARGRSGTTLR